MSGGSPRRGLSASDLGIPAASEALADAGVPAEEVDLVITATISPDQIMPATAARVAYELRLCAARAPFDVSAGCTGFVYALAMAAGAVASGMHEHVLVVGAETISRIIDWEDRSTAILFGDGAGAAVRRRCLPGERPRRSAGTAHHGRPASWASTWAATAPGARSSSSRPAARACPLPATRWTPAQHYMKMNGQEVYKFATRVVAQSAGRVLEQLRPRRSTRSTCSCPIRPICASSTAAAKKLGIAAEKVYTNLQKYGNTSCASIPSASARRGPRDG